MSTATTALARPLVLPNGFVLPNRLVKAAMSECLGNHTGAAGKNPNPAANPLTAMTRYLSRTAPKTISRVVRSR